VILSDDLKLSEFLLLSLGQVGRERFVLSSSICLHGLRMVIRSLEVLGVKLSRLEVIDFVILLLPHPSTASTKLCSRN
jgi:hypothetical protein